MPISTLADNRSSLPVSLTPFVGREREVAEVAAIFQRGDAQLLVLTGPGGVGKTRLALRTAAEIGPNYSDGVCFVPLASIHDPALVALTIAELFGLQVAGTPPVTALLINHLRDAELLLVLDSFERVTEAAPFVGQLLAVCPRLQILVTSRVRLRVSGEREYVVTPLPVVEPDAGVSLDRILASDAVQLFLDRARNLEPNFPLSPDTIHAISAVCHRLDGLPLAIELAASWVKVLPPAPLLVRLEQRLPLLTGGPRDAPVRQWTMHDTIAWSYDMLTPEEQACFECLSVFVGGFNLDAAAAVSRAALRTEVLAHIATLVDHSLLQRVSGSVEEPRYAMLDTVREFATEKLDASGESERIRAQHATWCLSITDGLDLWGDGQADSLARLTVEHDNLRSALTWLLARAEANDAQRLAGNLWEFWFMAGHAAEGRQWLERSLTLGDAEPSIHARALTGAGALAYQAGDLDPATKWITAGAMLYRQFGDHLMLGVTSGLLGNVAMASGDLEQAQRQFEEELGAYCEAGHAIAGGVAMLNLGRVATLRGDHEKAETLLARAREQVQSGGSRWDFAVATYYLGRVAAARGDPARALFHFQDGLARFRDLADPTSIVHCLEGIASVTASTMPGKAALLLGACTIARQRMVRPPNAEDQSLLADTEAALRVALGAEKFEGAFAQGQSLPIDAAITAGLAAALAVAVCPDPVDPTSTLGLTQREREVLHLVAEGRSDREIAAVLFISPKTVGLHVSHVLGKLGVPSRAAAVAYVHRHGLIEALSPPPTS
jgi:predicted ATPase/DNA-binding CsgD family transcriptional regulator